MSKYIEVIGNKTSFLTELETNKININVDGKKILRDKGISEENINNIYLHNKLEDGNSRFANYLENARDYEISMFLYIHDKVDKNSIYTGTISNNKKVKGDFFVNKKWFDLKVDANMNRCKGFYFPIGKVKHNKYRTSDWFEYGEYDYVLYMNYVSGTVYILDFNKCLNYVLIYGEYVNQSLEHGRTEEISEAYILSIQKAYDLGLVCKEFTFPKEYLKLGYQINHSKIREIKEGKI